ncbi:hypothetical protein [Parachryseolinea silvisoli]|jgi:hypothetical protein|uniref:hypothetical protein n=1 Tax=Parachryseolinea silvisoli TaxID=2873601 RepID=UPI002265A373|nr:hypothetical protein [Parachryseolinea silvisoli]MCD9014339.1 hypothetical protein [Parachryseolinea silvisoli]
MSQAASIETYLYQEDLYSLPPRVLVIVSDPWEKLTEAEQTTLTKMITALRLNIATVQIITRTAFTMADLAAYAPTKVIALGATLQGSNRLYESFTQDGLPVVVADALPRLDDLKKKNLWLALRQMFGV